MGHQAVFSASRAIAFYLGRSPRIPLRDPPLTLLTKAPVNKWGSQRMLCFGIRRGLRIDYLPFLKGARGYL